MLRPHLAEVSGQLFLADDHRAKNLESYLELKRGTKGGRARWVPIDTPEKRAALEEAKQFVRSETGHLGDPLRHHVRVRNQHTCQRLHGEEPPDGSYRA